MATRVLKRPLGSTGIETAVLGLGTVKFGRTAGVKYRQAYALPSDGQIADLLAAARALGVNLLDTAPAYGRSEERLGEAIEGTRPAWLLCTKVGEERDGARSRYDFGEDQVLRSVGRSLRRLRTDTLDIVLVHSDGRGVAAIEAAGALRALRRLQREGVVRAVGFSGKGTAEGEAALPASDVLMCTVNARDRREIPLVAKAGASGVGVLVKKPLASGFETSPATLAATAALPGVCCVVTGTLSVEHLVANAAALSPQRGARRVVPSQERASSSP